MSEPVTHIQQALQAVLEGVSLLGTAPCTSGPVIHTPVNVLLIRLHLPGVWDLFCKSKVEEALAKQTNDHISTV